MTGERNERTYSCLECDEFTNNRLTYSKLGQTAVNKAEYVYLSVVHFPLISSIFFLEPRRDEVTGEWGKLHNEELNDLYCSPNIVWVIKSRIRDGLGMWRVLVRRGSV